MLLAIRWQLFFAQLSMLSKLFPVESKREALIKGSLRSEMVRHAPIDSIASLFDNS